LDINVVNASRTDRSLPREATVVTEMPRMARRVAHDGPAPLSTALLRAAAREAGLFQRSVLGHLDHHDWSNRVHADAQRLTDLLQDMGFRPSEGRVNKLRQ